MNASIRRRHVLFFGGFDPKGASWYHAVYARHAALQAAVNGMSISVGPRRHDAQRRPYWDVAGSDAGGDCAARVEIVGWDDTVRRFWPRTPWETLRTMLHSYARMFRHGTAQMLRVRRISPRTAFALFYPLLLFVTCLLAIAAAGTIAGVLVAGASGSAIAGIGAGTVAAALLLAAAWQLERRLDTGLLARIYAFVGEYALGGIPRLDATLDAAARRIAEIAEACTADEILVVGYSVGSILASRVVARALPLLDSGSGPRLALLTLGNCIPLYGLYPQAGEYRAELARLAASERIDWIDVSSPGDWGSFALLDPLYVCEIEPARTGRGAPHMLSPRFHTLFAPERYAAIARDKHAMHTQYLMSTELPGTYDYFAITAGTQPLATRFPRKVPHA